MENLPVLQKDRGLFFDVNRFEHAQRVVKMLAASTLVPETFRNNVGNCLIALNYAERLNCDPIMLMQKMFIVHGRPGVEAQLKIALVNNSERFTPLRWKHEGKDTDDWKCTAYAEDKETGKLLEFTLSWSTVVNEGWLKKQGSKWKTMPEKMMQYRSGSWWADLFCPEVTLGLPTRDELESAIEIEPVTVTSDLEQKILEAPAEKEPDPELTGENEFICTICGFEAVSKRGLAKHTTMSHGEDDDKEPPVTMISDQQKAKLYGFLPIDQVEELAMWNYGKVLNELSSLVADNFITNFDDIYKEYQDRQDG